MSGGSATSAGDTDDGWTLVGRQADDEEREDETISPPDADEEEVTEEEEEEEDDDETALMGQRVQEIKDTGEKVEEVIVRRRRPKAEEKETKDKDGETEVKEEQGGDSKEEKVEEWLGAVNDESEDLSLASSPSLPDDMPAIKPDSQYVHHRRQELNARLNAIVALTLACVIGLGIGHFLGWSSRSLWEEHLSSSQVRQMRALRQDLRSCKAKESSISLSHPPTATPSPVYSLPSVPPLAQAPIQGPTEDFTPEALPSMSSFTAMPQPVLTQAWLMTSSLVDSLIEPLEDAGIASVARQAVEGHLEPSMGHDRLSDNLIEITSDDLSGTRGVLISDDIPAYKTEFESDIRPQSTTDFVLSETISQLRTEVLPDIPNVISDMRSDVRSTSDFLSPTTTSSFEFDLTTDHSDANLWDQTQRNLPLTHVKILEQLTLENEFLEGKISELQTQNTSPIKIQGSEGREARWLREQLTRLIVECEDLRVALRRNQFSALPEADKTLFHALVRRNQQLRVSAAKLTHLGPDLEILKASHETLKKHHTDLLVQVGKARQEQDLPKELLPLVKQLQEVRTVVAHEARKPNPPAALQNAKAYVAFLSQLLSSFGTLSSDEEISAALKIESAVDLFSLLTPKGAKMPSKVQNQMIRGRALFLAVKKSLAEKWKQLRSITAPESIVKVGPAAISRMHRVLVRSAARARDVAHAALMGAAGKGSDVAVETLSEALASLQPQIDDAWDVAQDLKSTSEPDIFMEEKDTVESNDKDEYIAGGKIEDKQEKTDGQDKVIKGKDKKQEEEVKTIEIKETKLSGKERMTTAFKNKEVYRGRDKVEVPEKKQEIITKDSSNDLKKLEKREPYLKGREDTIRDYTNDVKKREPYTKVKEEYPRGRVEYKRKDFYKENEELTKEKQYVKEGELTKVKEKDKGQELKSGVVERDARSGLQSRLSSHKHGETEAIKDKDVTDTRYFKGQYNKYDKKQGAPDFELKKDKINEQEKEKLKDIKQLFDDSDDDDDNGEDDVRGPSKGLRRHWEKPQKEKKKGRKGVDYPGSGSPAPKRQFIRRRGD